MRVIVGSEDAETSRGHGGLLASSRMDNVPSSSPITTTQLGANDSQLEPRTITSPDGHSSYTQTVLEESSAACINKEQDEDDEEDAEAEAEAEEEEENKDDERRRATTSDDERRRGTTNIFFFFLRSTLG
ncbi:hypothetical protein HZH68_012131 [Vespula germanica]|uniref:Uncharacterized protein n=1 Tax=Vespula germanica TaxID=30212 RepID=A0A834N0B6_VESGE|nr:hypothetical protein HZH68_012131 [Vespula germanica]